MADGVDVSDYCDNDKIFTKEKGAKSANEKVTNCND